MNHQFGFRCIGKTAKRTPTIAEDTFSKYCRLDKVDKVDSEKETFLSCFTFDEEFYKHLKKTRSTKEYDGSCYSPFIWFDIDDEQLQWAYNYLIALIEFLLDQDVSFDELLVFYSGSKGFHVGIPVSLLSVQPSRDFNLKCKSFATAIEQQIAERQSKDFGFKVDRAVYVKVQPLRAPNTKHGKTGRYKVRLNQDDLDNVECMLLGECDDIKALGNEPKPFEFQMPTRKSEQLQRLWDDGTNDICEAIIQHHTQPEAGTIAEITERTKLNESTIEFIKHGASLGDRHRLLFSASANLAEFNANERLIHALLSEPARASGLSEYDISRQIRCGIERTQKKLGGIEDDN